MRATVALLAGLPDLPSTERGVRIWLRRHNVPVGRDGKRFVFSASDLPQDVQIKLQLRAAEASGLAIGVQDDAAWAAHLAKPAGVQAMAGERVALVAQAVTAQVEPYVEALGAELAMEFLLRFGGADIFIAAKPKGRAEWHKFLGNEGAHRLAEIAHANPRFQRRVPIGNDWLIRMLAWQGKRVPEIARTVRLSDVAVRKYLKGTWVR